MSGRLAEVGQRIATIHGLSAVVNAMRGIAGARAQQARALMPAIRAYAETTARAIGQVRQLMPAENGHRDVVRDGRRGLILFGAEQGFAGAFPEQGLDAVAADFADSHIFLVGSRTGALAAARGLRPSWTAGLPSRADALPGVAAMIVDALYDHLARAGPLSVEVAYSTWQPGERAVVARRSLLPFDPTAFPASLLCQPPLINVPAAELIEKLAQEYVFAQLCEAAAEAFAAENEARMTTMAAAHAHIDGKLEALRAEERVVRQEEITAEVVELAGARAQVRRRK